MKTDITQCFIKKLSDLDRSKTTSEKFFDFCEMAYCSLAKLTADSDKGERLETRYMEIVGSYRDKDTIRAYPELLAIVTEGLWTGQDALGVIAAELGVLEERQGQFFSPMEICRMMVALTLPDPQKAIEPDGFITMVEPCVGAGAMLIAAADHLHRQGLDPSRHMLAYATELNRLSYHMAFIQLSMKGIPAYVEHGNSLSLERFDGAWTIGARYFYEIHGQLFPEGKVPESRPEPPSPMASSDGQFDLFNFED